MKRLHRTDLFCWSSFQESLNIDFNSFLWTNKRTNVLIDPLPLSAHDEQHLRDLGGAQWIVITNSFHVRGAKEIGQRFGAKIAGPMAEREGFALRCERWLQDNDEVVPGLRVRELDGSKTPGELALVLEETTLIAGDLIRAHRADTLILLGPELIKSPEKARASIARLLDLHPRIETVLVGDGWFTFRHGGDLLRTLIQT